MNGNKLSKKSSIIIASGFILTIFGIVLMGNGFVDLGVWIGIISLFGVLGYILWIGIKSTQGDKSKRTEVGNNCPSVRNKDVFKKWMDDRFSSAEQKLEIKKFDFGHEDWIEGYKVWHHGPNPRYGDTSIHFWLKNRSEKVIKYVDLYFTAVNGVGDVVISRNGGDSPVRSCQVTGPIQPNKSEFIIFRDVFWNTSIKSVKIVDIEVQYMDGSIEHIKWPQ